MKEHRHYGVYGLVVENDKILLINKVTGPYDGKLDLPGGSFEFGERPEEVLKRELNEETGIIINKYQLFDSDSVLVKWNNNGEIINVHHVGIFYKIFSYSNEVKSKVLLEGLNDDSLGASFYDINSLNRNSLSEIAILELEKLGYRLK